MSTTKNEQTMDPCCTVSPGAFGVDALIGVDERGQMVLPKDLRDKVGIQPGDKFAVVSLREGDDVCCLCLVPAKKLAEQVKSVLGPLVQALQG